MKLRDSINFSSSTQLRDVRAITDAELRDWALTRYGSERLACKLAIVRQMHADLQISDHHRDVSDDVERPASVIYSSDEGTAAP